MNFDKYTEKSREAIQQSQFIAEEYGQEEILPIHLLYALLTQEDGLIPRLIQLSDVSLEVFIQKAEKQFSNPSLLQRSTDRKRSFRSIYCMHY
jgi:ATP-dependent Clp protease ATP-binding subunit ClpB